MNIKLKMMTEETLVNLPERVETYLEENNLSDESESPLLSYDDVETVVVQKKRNLKVFDSDSDLEKENIETAANATSKSEDEHENIIPQKKCTKRMRIRMTAHSESDSDSSSKYAQNIGGNTYESERNKDKRKKLNDKFSKLKSPYLKSAKQETEKPFDSENNDENSEDEVSCLKIKQKIKKSMLAMSSICDPDTSDEENEREIKQAKKKPKCRMTKPTSPKPLKMTTKQAMENMQKIKSESNRMLREKEVSLPYHRPKALTLKDILSRRKPAIAADGKALPIKMNNEQLRQYAMMLEQRQKEVIELCKSDTEDEESPDCMDQSNNLINDENKIETSSSILEKKTVEEGNEATDISIESDNLETKILIDQSGTKQKKTIDDEKEKESVETETVKEQTAVAEHGMDEDNEIIVDSYKKITKDSREDTLDTDNQAAEKVSNTVIQVKEVDENREVTAAENDTTVKKKVDWKLDHDNLSENDISMNSISEDQNVELPKEVNTSMEDETQAMILKYDSEIYSLQDKNKKSTNNFEDDEDEFLNNDYSFDEISKIIEQAEVNDDTSENEKFKESIHNTIQAVAMPKLTGGPGMVINLDDDEPAPRKLSGVELLKERFSYFAKLKTPEDIEKEKEKKYKPGTQHLKLRHELENQIAEQRSIEWEKRLEDESKLKSEMKTLSDEDDNDNIEKLEAKLEEIDEKGDETSEGEEEPIENDVIIEDKPMKRNPMMDDEAEESECNEDGNEVLAEEENEIPDNEDDEEEESSDSSSEEEEESRPRKGRILKAFEDSDDESNKNNVTMDSEKLVNNEENESPEPSKTDPADIKDSQDDELQLAQRNKSSDDLFSLESEQNLNVATLNKNNDDNTSTELGTQTFSIMHSVDASCLKADLISPDKNVSEADAQNNINLHETDKVNSEKFALNQLISQNSQSEEIGDDIAAMCTGKFYDNPFVSQDSSNKDGEKPVDDISQEIGDDVAELCTGKFYDNPFVSQNEEEPINGDSEKHINELNQFSKDKNKFFESKDEDNTTHITDEDVVKEKTVLKSILEGLDEPEPPKQNKYFGGSKDSELSQKKKFVIDSDDETNEEASVKKKKKLKKRKAEDRALQISDDEEDELAEEEDYDSNIEEDEERVVEYDSEENEVEVQQDKPKKKKRIGEFFENEAELTSEDEWIGSGDEDERGLDRMEREEGDDDTFHQGQLQRELGQIHMREVLDQDKREVRLIQELLFEDGDLGDGHRQRKFRWRNADGEIETGTNPDEFADTQEEDFESEEQWRKERHEREMFLRQMQEDDSDLNTSINRTTIIKANLNSRSMSTLINETKNNKTENETNVPEKKTNKDIPSPKKPFTIFKQNYHNSLLTRGRGALARLAALATPLATDDATTTVAANGRNFVFTIKEREEPKVTKRKAENNVGTPRLIKKMKTEETNKQLKSTLFDLLKS